MKRNEWVIVHDSERIGCATGRTGRIIEEIPWKFGRNETIFSNILKIRKMLVNFSYDENLRFEIQRSEKMISSTFNGYLLAKNIVISNT